MYKLMSSLGLHYAWTYNRIADVCYRDRLHVTVTLTSGDVTKSVHIYFDDELQPISESVVVNGFHDLNLSTGRWRYPLPP
jgi:hypothetical protein